MHINFDDENIIVQHLQVFLKRNFMPSLNISGIYDTGTHDALIKYLKTPNTADVYTIRELIHKNFIYREVNPPHAIIDGGGIINFDNTVTPDTIIYYTKPTSRYYTNGVNFISKHIEEFNEFIKNYGWSVNKYSSLGSGDSLDNRTRAEIHIAKTGITNFFPNSDVLPMVNLFNGKYIYNKSFVAPDTFAGYISDNKKYKIAAIPCNPGDTFTLTHGYSMACEMAIGYSELTYSQLKHSGSEVQGVVNRLESGIQGAVYPGTVEYYEIPESSQATYLLVQMPYRDDLTSYQTQKISIKLGDINMDGVVDATDVNLLEQWVTAKEKNLAPPFDLTDRALIAANVTRDIDLDGNPIINRDDVTVLRSAVESGNTNKLGTAEYEQQVRVSSSELDRLLVMSGELAANEDLNIPVDQFWISPWAVHEKFIQYLLGRVIHPYSDIEDITWLQKNIRTVYGEYNDKYAGKYDVPEDYLVNNEFIYNEKIGTYEYHVDGVYSGLYLKHGDTLKDGVLLNNDGTESNITIVNSRIYVNNDFEGIYVLSDGKVAKANAENSLKSVVKKFQMLINSQFENEGTPTAERLKWTLGYYDVDTDKEFIRYVDGNVTYDYGSFK